MIPSDVPFENPSRGIQYLGGAQMASASAFSGPNANTLLQREYEDLAVTDLAVGLGPATLGDRLDCGLDEFVVHRDLDCSFLSRLTLISCPAIDLREPELPAETLDLQDRQPEDLNIASRLSGPPRACRAE